MKVMGDRQMEKIVSIEEGLVKLFKMREMDVPKYSYQKEKSNLVDKICYKGNEVPIFFWRHEPKIMGLRGYGQAIIEDNCTLNVYSFSGREVSLEELLFQEMDIAEHVLGARIKKVTAFRNGDACNIIGVTELGSCVNLEIGTTMAEGSTNQCQHRLITKHGMANDRAVDTQVVQEAIYVYDNRSVKPTTYSDLDEYLYGLSNTDVMKTSFAYSILAGEQNACELVKQGQHLYDVVKAVQQSVEERATISVIKREEGQNE